MRKSSRLGSSTRVMGRTPPLAMGPTFQSRTDALTSGRSRLPSLPRWFLLVRLFSPNWKPVDFEISVLVQCGCFDCEGNKNRGKKSKPQITVKWGEENNGNRFLDQHLPQIWRFQFEAENL